MNTQIYPNQKHAIFACEIAMESHGSPMRFPTEKLRADGEIPLTSRYILFIVKLPLDHINFS